MTSDVPDLMNWSGHSWGEGSLLNRDLSEDKMTSEVPDLMKWSGRSWSECSVLNRELPVRVISEGDFRSNRCLPREDYALYGSCPKVENKLLLRCKQCENMVLPSDYTQHCTNPAHNKLVAKIRGTAESSSPSKSSKSSSSMSPSNAIRSKSKKKSCLPNSVPTPPLFYESPAVAPQPAAASAAPGPDFHAPSAVLPAAPTASSALYGSCPKVENKLLLRCKQCDNMELSADYTQHCTNPAHNKLVAKISGPAKSSSPSKSSKSSSSMSSSNAIRSKSKKKSCYLNSLPTPPLFYESPAVAPQPAAASAAPGPDFHALPAVVPATPTTTSSAAAAAAGSAFVAAARPRRRRRRAFAAANANSASVAGPAPAAVTASASINSLISSNSHTSSAKGAAAAVAPQAAAYALSSSTSTSASSTSSSRHKESKKSSKRSKEDAEKVEKTEKSAAEANVSAKSSHTPSARKEHKTKEHQDHVIHEKPEPLKTCKESTSLTARSIPPILKVAVQPCPRVPQPNAIPKLEVPPQPTQIAVAPSTNPEPKDESYMPISPVTVVSSAPLQFLQLRTPTTKPLVLTIPLQHNRSNIVASLVQHPRPLAMSTRAMRRIGSAYLLQNHRIAHAQRNQLREEVQRLNHPPEHNDKFASERQVSLKRPMDRVSKENTKHIRLNDVNGFILHADVSESAEAPVHNSVHDKVTFLNMK